MWSQRRFSRSGIAVLGVAMLLGTGLVTGLVAGPAAAVGAQHPIGAGKGVTKPRRPPATPVRR
jgi:hypothetical protein